PGALPEVPCHGPLRPSAQSDDRGGGGPCRRAHSPRARLSPATAPAGDSARGTTSHRCLDLACWSAGTCSRSLVATRARQPATLVLSTPNLAIALGPRC